MADILEIIMLVCFGFSWPLNIIKSVRTKSTKGKSLWFLILVDFGYVCGITAKFMNCSIAPSHVRWVFTLVVYFINLFMVSGDMVLYFINKSRENKTAKVSGAVVCD